MASERRVPNLKEAFTDHDRLFKELLTVFFEDFIDLFLPDMAAELDRESVTFLGSELFADIASGEKHVVDILASVQFRHEDTCFLIHVENQSSRQAEFARRMFDYFAILHRKHRLPVYPVAVLSFDEPSAAEPDEYRVTFPSFEPLLFRFHAIQLNRLNWRDFVNRPNPVAAALMAKMQIAPEERPRVKLQCLRLLATLKLDPAKSYLISGFIDTYLRLSPAESDTLQRELDALPADEREATMPLTISWKEEGRVEGLAEGRTEGAREMLLGVARKRLGEPTPETMAALEAIRSVERFQMLLEKLPSVETWDRLLATETE